MLKNLLIIILVAGMSCDIYGQAVLKPRQVIAPDYVLGPGDQIDLHVLDMEELASKPIRIDPNGYIDLPLIGRVQASGLSLEQLKADLATKLNRYVTSPQVSINLTEDFSHPVSVVGSVNLPGVQQLHAPKRLLEVISQAGGLRADAGSRVIVTRQLRWGALPLAGSVTDAANQVSTATLPADSLMNSRDAGYNIFVEPNDIVSIPKAEIVYVLGNVKKAGGFALSTRGNISLLQALAMAEGMDSNAAASKARILRSGNGAATRTEIPVDIPKIAQGKAEDVPLFADDVLFIPNSALRASARRVTDAALAITTGVIIYH